MIEFYDQLARFYHLIFQDWDQSIARQAQQLTEIIKSEWGSEITRVLDLSCGIGTQVIGLAQSGFHVTGSDLSAEAIARAGREAARVAWRSTSPFATCATPIGITAAVMIS